MSNATIEVITEENMPASILFAKRLVGVRGPVGVNNQDADYTIAVCENHAIVRTTAPIAVLPKAVEDSERYCADCVRKAGFTYAVELVYFKPHGKYYSSGYFFTSKQHIFEVQEEVYEMIRAGVNPGLTPGAVGRNEFITQITVTNHPERYPILVLKP